MYAYSNIERVEVALPELWCVCGYAQLRAASSQAAEALWIEGSRRQNLQL
eukprot:CAMPEP_0117472602 /NCGR_PEP_ID=MMETSP0784-20121206/8334_1 /TAXON_ID=39447 /ORGANISM="" /LENGTH=49 /DNA_ID=CAMNT_0005266763 /DNA_START=875 /DNA_END=1024 /DNA_ORIENTATION=-